MANARAACCAATKALVVFILRSASKASRVREGDSGSWGGFGVADAAVCGYIVSVGLLFDEFHILLLLHRSLITCMMDG